ncbi:MAG TPA: hypothetical protein VHW45_13305 [Candidatus Sulfotelmatobacter sp.]|nr:hypothetical protein [Candidatus Sulfotelmatobacter sp.]
MSGGEAGASDRTTVESDVTVNEIVALPAAMVDLPTASLLKAAVGSLAQLRRAQDDKVLMAGG